jgi:hypothetical protein
LQPVQPWRWYWQERFASCSFFCFLMNRKSLRHLPGKDFDPKNLDRCAGKID